VPNAHAPRYVELRIGDYRDELGEVDGRYAPESSVDGRCHRPLARRRPSQEPRAPAVDVAREYGPSKDRDGGFTTSVLDQGFYFDAPPSEACEQREVRPAVEGQVSKATTPASPHEVASFLTNRMAVKAARSSMRGRPPWGLGDSLLSAAARQVPKVRP
jgi:hypothetical protein